MSTGWGSATDSKGSRISLLDDNTTSQSTSSSSSQDGSNDSSTSSRQQSSAGASVLPPISPLLNVSYPGAAQTSIKRALNVSTATPQETPYYTQTNTSGSSINSPMATTPGFSEYPSATASAYSPRDTGSVLDPCLTSAGPYSRDRPTFSRPSSFSLPRSDILPLRYSSVVSERMPSYIGSVSGSLVRYSASPPSAAERQSYLRRGDDLRRKDSYQTASSSSTSLDSESLGPFTPRDEDPSWTRRYQLGGDPYAGSTLGKRPREESETEYQYPPPPPGPEESRYDGRYPEDNGPYPYSRQDSREYRPRNGHTYPPPPPPYRDSLSYGPGPPATAYPLPPAASSRYSPIRTQPTRSSSLRTPISRPPEVHPSPSTTTNGSHSTNPPPSGIQKKFPCRFSHVPPIFCTQTFTTSGHASRHAKIHKEEKGIGCVYPGCAKRFTRADNMKQHLETHFRVRGRGKGNKGKAGGEGGKGEGKASKGDGEDDIDRAEMQRLLREGAVKRESERGERDWRQRRKGEMSMSMSVSPRSLRTGERPYYEATAPQRQGPLDGLDALATVAVGRK